MQTHQQVKLLHIIPIDFSHGFDNLLIIIQIFPAADWDHQHVSSKLVEPRDASLPVSVNWSQDVSISSSTVAMRI